MPEAGGWRPEAGGQISGEGGTDGRTEANDRPDLDLDARGWRPEAGGWRLEAAGWTDGWIENPYMCSTRASSPSGPLPKRTWILFLKSEVFVIGECI